MRAGVRRWQGGDARMASLTVSLRGKGHGGNALCFVPSTSINTPRDQAHQLRRTTFDIQNRRYPRSI